MESKNKKEYSTITIEKKNSEIITFYREQYAIQAR